MADCDAETLAMLQLCLCEGLGPRSIHRLLRHFGSAEAVLAAGPAARAAVEALPPKAASALNAASLRGEAETEIERARSADVELLAVSSPDYPTPLRYLEEEAPPLLWVMGRWQRRDQLAVAVVGSRRCSAYGRTQARRFAGGLAAMGFTIVSGLARGIDSEAHRAALRAGGRTIAVLGCGLGALTSRDDVELAEWISDNGAVLSELPMTTPPRPANFPPRNRLLSGLSLGVLVVEAATRSGSLITARWAGEQGKSVFAVPGPVDCPTSGGPHALIRDGAILVQQPREVVESLGPLTEPIEVSSDIAAEAGQAEFVEDPRVLALSKRERELYDHLGSAPLQIDQVIDATGLAPSIVSSILLTLEIRGLVKQIPGHRYVRG